MSISTHNIKAKSHILTLLGDELIGSDSLAIFELVKNAYDADADNISVEFVDLNTLNQKIIVEDDGHGMSSDVIKNVWLTIGTDFKRGSLRKPSKKYGRVSLGNKGVGRLAVHKLAQSITVETQIQGDMFSNRFTIDWKTLIESKEYIQDLTVDLEYVGESLFKKGQGTRIILSGLLTKHWTKAALRDLARKIENIKNPFNEVPNFNIEIKANDSHQNWLENIKTSTEILKDSLYQFDFILKPWSEKHKEPEPDDFAEFLYSYKFNAHPLMKAENEAIPPRSVVKNTPTFKKEDVEKFLIGNGFKEIDSEDRNKYILNSDLNNIGPISGKFFVFNLSKNIFNLYFGGQVNAVKEYIKQNYGIKIFRDNIRVYNYGEQLDDWLDLDLNKIQRTGDHFARKVTIGAVELALDKSENGLIEKTNREGFNDNHFYKKFQTIVHNVFEFFEKVASEDKDKVEEFVDKLKPIKKVGLSETIKELSEKIRDKNLTKELEPLILRVEKDYNEMRDVMVNSGMTGLNLGVVFHEVDREMRFINSDLSGSDVDINGIRGRVKNLIQILENFSPILRQNKNVNLMASELVERARQININRINFHKIIFSSPLLSKENEDFKISGPGNLLISTLSNLIDNSIFWVSAKRDLENEHKAGIYIGTDLKSFDGPAIIIADNGTGFNLEPEELTQPFKTTKPGGMGLGLYFSNLVLEMIGGKLIFPDSSDLEIPRVYNGACIALVFPKK